MALNAWERIKKTLEYAEHLDFISTWGPRTGNAFLALAGGKGFQVLFSKLATNLSGEATLIIWLIFSGLVFWGLTAIATWRKRKRHGPELDGELQRILIYPHTGTMGYKLANELWRKSHSENIKVDCDILTAIYIVNQSPSKTQYVRDLKGSVEVSGIRKNLERQDDFLVAPDNGDSFEYGLETGMDNYPEPLKKLFPALPQEIAPLKPIDGWVKFTLKEVDPEKIDSQKWQFAIVDSLGKEHPIIKTSDKPKEGEIGFRRSGS